MVLMVPAISPARRHYALFAILGGAIIVGQGVKSCKGARTGAAAIVVWLENAPYSRR